MKSAHGITSSDTPSFASSSNVMFQLTLSSKPMFSEPVLRKYKNVVVNYVVEGGITLRAVGGVHFKKFVERIRVIVNSNDPTTDCRVVPHLGTIVGGISV
jgi:hypothetical protein